MPIRGVNRGIPVVVLAGFLGSGKTTLLNHLLHNSGGRRIGVLVNDFGSVNIDALLVSGQSAGALNLSNGCVCCTVDADTLSQTLAELGGSGVDAIVIEASGIAEPKALIRMVLAARDERLAYGGLVYLVDAVNIAGTLSAHPAVADHVAVADLVVCNKIDLIDDAEAAALAARLRGLNPTAPVVETIEAAVDPELLFDPSATGGIDDGPRQLTFGDLLDDLDPESRSHGHRHLHAEFESVSLATPRAVDPRRLAAFLERPPTGAYRCKGTVLVDLPGHREAAYEVHAVGGFVRVSRRPWTPDGPSTSLVVIGAGLDAEKARAMLDDVVVAPDPADVNGILHLTRHLPTVTSD
ncbi:MAG: GTP-binding protein [Gordonia sp. (in: high G+C Gram-positive bacteria)]